LERGLARSDVFAPSGSDILLPSLLETHGDVDVLVAGHTHLARTRDRTARTPAYLNTGTWADLVHVRPEDIASPQATQALRAALASSDRSALGRYRKRGGWVAVVEKQKGGVRARLEGHGDWKDRVHEARTREAT
jgi:hypothetical protein